jgi:GTP-binding protein Era
MSFKSGFVALIGRPNVGKSTLLNRLVGQKIAIESPVVQTTRHRIRGVVTSEKGQIVFLDTPGLITPKDTLGSYLTDEAGAALAEADGFLFVVDATVPPGPGDETIAKRLLKAGRWVVLILNKSDRFSRKSPHSAAYQALVPGAKVLAISAKTGKNTEQLLEVVLRQLSPGPAYYPEESVTDQRLREMSAEMIREQVLLLTRDELPHSVAVGIELFDESQPGLIRIEATLYVDQPSQKGMVIGAGGQMIKEIGTEARKVLEALLERPVFLGLNVKVKRHWRRNAQFLKSLGMAPPEQ